MFLKTSQQRDLAFSFLFLAGIVLTTFIVIPLTGVGFTLPRLVVFSLLAVLGNLWLLFRTDCSVFRVIRSHMLGRGLLLYIIVVFASLSWSVMPVVSTFGAAPRFDGLLTFTIYISFALCALALCQTEHGLHGLIRTIILCNAGVVLYGLLQVLGLDPFGVFWDRSAFLGRTFSFLGQPNALGSFIVLTIPFVGVKTIKSMRNERFVYIALLTMNVLVLLSTASRAALIAFVVVAILFLNRAQPFLVMIRRHTSFIHRALIAVALLLVLVAGYVSFISRFTLETEKGRSFQSRQVIWTDALEMYLHRPQGYGLETMGTLYPMYKSKALVETESLTSGVDRAHSKPLDLLITLGPLGLLFYYFFIGSLILASLRRQYQSGAMFAGGLGILGYSTSLLFGFETLLTSVFFWIIAGMIMGLTWRADPEEQYDVGRTWLVRFVLIILLLLNVCGSVVFLQWSRQRTRMEIAEYYFQNGQLSTAVGAYAVAAQEFAFDRELIIKFIETSLVTAEHTPYDAERDRFADIAEKGIDGLEQFAAKDDGMAPLMRAWLAAIRKDTLGVRDHVRSAKSLMPNTVDTYRIAAHAYDLIGNTNAALLEYRNLLELFPSYWQDPDSEAARIFRKENPWVEMLMEKKGVRQLLKESAELPTG